jgi:hypothetical protein
MLSWKLWAQRSSGLIKGEGVEAPSAQSQVAEMLYES